MLPWSQRNFIKSSSRKTNTNKILSWFSYVFTYSGDNHALLGFFNAIELVLETGFALTAFLAVILNLIIPEEIEDEETPEITANTIDEGNDQAEWNYIRRKSQASRNGSVVGTGSVIGHDKLNTVLEAQGEKKASEL